MEQLKERIELYCSSTDERVIEKLEIVRKSLTPISSFIEELIKNSDVNNYITKT